MLVFQDVTKTPAVSPVKDVPTESAFQDVTPTLTVLPTPNVWEVSAVLDVDPTATVSLDLFADLEFANLDAVLTLTVLFPEPHAKTDFVFSDAKVTLNVLPQLVVPATFVLSPAVKTLTAPTEVYAFADFAL